MIYNDFNGLKLSRLGFGCMRFALDPATGEIDQDKVNAMFELAYNSGVNYYDTAYPYLDGKSENAMAEALSRYPRDSYYIADKFPGHSLPGPIDNIALFNISLERCRTDYFDFYLLHNVTEWSVKIYESEEYHIIPDVLKMKEEGKIRHLGFSFHGGPDLLDELLTKYEGVFEFVQIQCNYLDWTLQDAKRKYDIITKHGLGVWVMEPCRGGKLANLPEEFSNRLKEFNPDASDASYAFRFLQGLPNIRMILSGMNEVFQVEDNLNTFKEYVPLTDAERDTLFEIAEGMKRGVPCTGCRYCCAGCPMELNIPYLLECYNDYKFSTSLTASMRIDGLDPDKRPSNCIGCGQCAHACPQGIDVPAALAELSDLYANGPTWAQAAKGRHESIKKDLGME
ncbi:MAG: aldo/keto reductase [Oscillospiraceae bacterium]|nr:aldo/keto reductase [Oscillospiraceae bacterium]MDO5137300.1 aldo/keto reductase [Oscillospiraceae bacterium]